MLVEFETAAGRALDTAVARGAEYADTRFEVERAERIEVRNGVVATLSDATSTGMGVRALFDGSWGFAATSDLSDAGIDAAYVPHAINLDVFRPAGDRRELRERRGMDPDAYVGLDTAEDEPLGGQVEPLMVVYAKGPARPLHEVSFLLGRLAGQSLQRIRLVLAPELREPVAHALGF